MKKFRSIAATLYARLGAYVTVMLTTEPVRVRAWLTSAVVALATVIPALAQSSVSSAVAGVGLAALTALAGEATREKVTPVGGK